jgi:hypothetical protein
MKTRCSLLILLLASWPIASPAGSDSDVQPQVVLQWQSDSPTCFDPKVELKDRFESVSRFMVGGDVTEPEKISGENPKTEHFEDIELHTGIPVVELVIYAEGKVELVASLRTTTPEFDKRLAELISTWVFKPATSEGKPICIRYILTVFIHYI